MRLVALVCLLSGCSLYFGSAGQTGDDIPPDARNGPTDGSTFPPIDACPTDAGATGTAIARCEDGQILVTTTSVFPDQPGHGAGRPIGRCLGACRSAAVACAAPDCRDAAATLCGAPASLGATCSLDGTACRGTGSIACPETTACSGAVAGSSCTCTDGVYRCAQLTRAAAVQAALVGKWHGTVTTPGFTAPYPVTLWIYPDGTYWPDCAAPHCSAFYYGGDGPAPDRRITVLSTSDTTGAWADVAIDFGTVAPNTGAIAGLTVDGTTLRFTFYASWFGCTQPIDFALTRY